MNEPILRVDNVSKRFCRTLKRSLWYGLKDMAGEFVLRRKERSKLRRHEFYALRDVSFEVHQGETLGVIGANGSGKSTLLKLINRIYKPDMGRITTRGRVGALITLGVGFNPVLTGRENIYINSAVMGIAKKKVDRLLEEIIDFAEIGDFIDAPVRNYSSGMKVRLGFSVAICIEPELLVIDEVLAVGDLSFQNKALRRLAELREKAGAVVFVSHNLENVRRICDRVLLLDNGREAFSGSTQETILRYHEMSREKQLAAVRKGEAFQTYGHTSSGDIVFSDSGILDKSGNRTDRIATGDDAILFFDFELKEDVDELYFSVGVLDEKRALCIWQMSDDSHTRFRNISRGRHRLTVNYKACNLVPGIYTPTFAVRNGRTGETYERVLQLAAFSVEGDSIPRGIVRVESDWRMEQI